MLDQGEAVPRKKTEQKVKKVKESQKLDMSQSFIICFSILFSTNFKQTAKSHTSQVHLELNIINVDYQCKGEDQGLPACTVFPVAY